MVKTIILAYHDIDTECDTTEKTDPPTIQTVVRLYEFEKQMEYLASSGYTVLSVEEYLNKMKEVGFSGDKHIVLTFDDGHISNFTYALPILKKHSFHATFFIVANFIGKQHYMGLEEINLLMECGNEIGSHGVTHQYLTELTHEDAIHEIVESKRLIEKQCDRQINVFAYPGGHQNSKIVECVEATGYKAAVSCILGRNSATTNPFLLRRIELRRGTSTNDLKKAITPKNIYFYQCIDMLKLFTKKTLGLRVYERLRQKFFYIYPFKR